MTQALLSRAFALLEAAAVAGERCPPNDQIPGRSASVTELARMGHIEVRISRLNYRTVELLRGPHIGKTTKSDGTHVYKVVNSSGCFINGRPRLPTDRGNHRQPSKPRDIGGGA